MARKHNVTKRPAKGITVPNISGPATQRLSDHMRAGGLLNRAERRAQKSKK